MREVEETGYFKGNENLKILEWPCLMVTAKGREDLAIAEGAWQSGRKACVVNVWVLGREKEGIKARAWNGEQNGVEGRQNYTHKKKIRSESGATKALDSLNELSANIIRS